MKIMMKIIPEKLTKKSFSIYGQVIGTHERKPDMCADWFDEYHNELDLSNFNVKISCDWLDLKNRGFVIRNLQRLPESIEIYLSSDGTTSLIPVAPNNPETNLPDYSKLKVFIIEKGMGILVEKNVWHIAPFPLKDLSTFVLLVRSACFLEDDKPLRTDITKAIVIDSEPYEIDIASLK
jgi:ureidoglycolate hydrolase